ncbi:MAG: glycosyltransferase [Planctomycetales bacterium]|nr:glycosyltransferase [Planctomycetales bacterium]
MITPTFRGQAHLEACLKSVADQQCERVEHIVVDGGSTDGTVELLQEWQQRLGEHRLRFVSEPDGGQSEAMNKGIALARGELLGFLNADDYYAPGAFDAVLDACRDCQHPAFVVGQCVVVDAAGDELWHTESDLSKLDLLERKFPVNPVCYFYSKSLHDQLGGYESDDHLAMDLEWLFRIVDHVHVTPIQKRLGTFVMHEASKTACGLLDGRTDAAADRVVQRYRRQLPLGQRWQWLCRRAQRECARQIKLVYTHLRHPRMILGLVRNKLLGSTTANRGNRGG